MGKKILGLGAEAIVYLDKDVVKERVAKGYRHSDLDIFLRKTRTRQEGRLLEKLKGKVLVPEVIDVDEDKMKIVMSHITGDLLRLCVSGMNVHELKKVFCSVGKSVSTMHSLFVVHGDLTTSNMVYSGGKVFLIDFGLGFVTRKIEDMAVDLHLFRQAVESAHYDIFEVVWKAFLKGYCTWEGSEEVLERLKRVDKRGRYKRRVL